MSRHGRFNELESIKMGNGQRWGYRVTCCRCERSETITTSSHHSISPVGLRVKFEQKGWRVGKTPAGDLCPEHAHEPRSTGARLLRNGDIEASDTMRRLTNTVIQVQRGLEALFALEPPLLRHVRQAIAPELNRTSGATKLALMTIDGALAGLLREHDELERLAHADAEAIPTAPTAAAPPPPGPPGPAPKQGIPQSVLDRARASLGMK